MEAENSGITPQKPNGFESVDSPIEKLMAEHDNEGIRHREIARLSNNYTMPADGCNTYKVTFELLKEFQGDLHLHILLENNILFLEAMKLENRFTTCKRLINKSSEFFSIRKSCVNMESTQLF